jgi:hypothetical protein
VRRAAGAAVDVLLAALAVVVLAIIITGGGVFEWQGHRVSVMGVDNPLLALVLLGALRYAALPDAPLFARPRWSLSNLDAISHATLAAVRSRVETLRPGSAARMVLAAAVAAASIKMLLAWANPGFFSGDDVEIHELSLGALWHTGWPIWDLRNALFPLGVVYPFQKLLALVNGGATAPAMVFAGRCAVALISSATVVLVWRAGVRMWPSARGWAVVAALLFATARLHIAFGSSELPRPVATVFVAGAFVLLLDPRAIRVLFAGILLGVAASFRFSEAMFIVPAAVMLASQRKWLAAMAVPVMAIVMSLTLLGVSDAWYWGTPFHSLRAAVDYTLVRQLSSRGYQSVVWYFVHLFEWVNPAVALLAAIAAIRAPRITDVWVWLPLAVLTLLPHKEARYAIPLVPFVCLMAARGLEVALPIALQPRSGRRPWRPIALLALLIVGLAFDAGHWRLARSNRDVEFAARANDTLPADAVLSAEQAWRLGGHLYFRSHALVDLDPGQLRDAAYLWQQTPAGASIILDRRTSSQSGLIEALNAHGYEKMPLTIDGSRYELWRPRAR